MNGNNLLS